MSILYILYIHIDQRGDLLNILIATSSKVPLFEQIKEQIKEQVFSGELKEGDALPSMRVLAKELKVSVITTKRAYEDLEQEGFLVSSVGRGTFVAGQQAHVLKEWQIREIENEIEKIVQSSQTIGLSNQELNELINLYFEEEQ